MKVLANDQLIEYKDEGTGKVLVLLHGWGADLRVFNDLAYHFSKQFRVIRFDFPGFGQSPKPNNNWSVCDYAELVSNLLKKLKIEEVYAVIGHSFGGRVIIKGISNKNFKPQKVVLIGSAGVKPRHGLKNNVYKSIAKVGKLATSMPVINRLQPSLRRVLYGSAGSSDYLQAQQMKEIFINVVSENLLPEVPNIFQPTLLVWGSEDKETPLDDARLILKYLTSGTLVVIKDAGHFVYSDKPKEVIEELDRFLA